MGNYQGGGFRGGDRGGDRGARPSFQKSWGGDRDRGSRGSDRGEVTMHKATCSDCGKTCEVPFRPTGEKPVFCNDCFGNKREGGDRGDRGTRDFAPRREFGSRPAPRFDAPRQSGDGEVKKQLKEISEKLDRLYRIVDKIVEPKKEVYVPKVIRNEAKDTKTLASVVEKVVENLPVAKSTESKKKDSKPATAKKAVAKKKK